MIICFCPVCTGSAVSFAQELSRNNAPKKNRVVAIVVFITGWLKGSLD
jgi:hypothetical protein